MNGFKQFLMRGNVIDLAIAVVMGAAFGNVVSSFVKNLLTPLIAIFGGQPNFADFYFTINGSQFRYGDFINSLITFLIIAAAIYYVVVVPLAKLKKPETEGHPAAEKKCPECLSNVPVEASRCAHCGQPIKMLSTLKSAS